jgi:hypothetical protein
MPGQNVRLEHLGISPSISYAESGVNRRRKEETRTPRITHDQVVELLVDYHLGRLGPEVNRAIEAHVARCPLCQVQGLVHTGIEKRAVQRRIRRVRPTRRNRISRRGRFVLVFLLMIILLQIALYVMLRANLITL